jgi:hypothetical protein
VGDEQNCTCREGFRIVFRNGASLTSYEETGKNFGDVQLEVFGE